MKILCEGLRLNRSLTALDLPDNNIGDDGIINLSVSIAKNPSMTQLQLSYNNIGDEGAKALAEVSFA
jgi:Ran GTPase-activating protein (RanGAP) involved in mRNA processing and transport